MPNQEFDGPLNSAQESSESEFNPTQGHNDSSFGGSNVSPWGSSAMSGTTTTASSEQSGATTSESMDSSSTLSNLDTQTQNVGPKCDPGFELTVASAEGDIIGALEWGQDPKYGKIGQGTATAGGKLRFVVDLPCSGRFQVSGLVWDGRPGAYFDNDPDSFFLRVDEAESRAEWIYGCDFQPGSQANWRWSTVSHYPDINTCKSSEDRSFPLKAGAHIFDFEDREVKLSDSMNSKLAKIRLRVL